MLAFPNTKINLGLNILEKREDGYHHIETCLYPVPLTDALEILPSDTFEFRSTGISISGPTSNNLCVKAYQLLKEQYKIPNASIHLHKVVPMGAGLGGGSSDGAFALKMLNEIFELNIPSETLKEMAAKLGSDCPFFIENKPAIATGTGTTLKPIGLNLNGQFLGLHFPAVAVSTKEAYSAITPKMPLQNIENVLSKSAAHWKKELINDFEQPIFDQYPELARAKQGFYTMGAYYAGMSGSGSTLFGLFEQEPAVRDWMKVLAL